MFIKSVIVLGFCVIIALYLNENHIPIVNSLRKSLPLVDSVIVFLHTGTLIPWFKNLFKISAPKQDIIKKTSKERMFTVEDLKQYNDEKSGLYLAVLGKVYDVSEGTKFYGRGGSYHFFTGRDGSRAFVTGDFTESGLIDHVLDLSPQDLRSLSEWVKLYDRQYKYKGKLIGRYYGEDGRPTDYQLALEQKIEQAKQETTAAEKEKLQFPPCNVEWSPETGTRVWCSKLSGGIHRDWIGVPRKLFEPGSETFRCACVNMESKNFNSKGNLMEYADCHPKASSCNVYDEGNKQY